MIFGVSFNFGTVTAYSDFSKLSPLTGSRFREIERIHLCPAQSQYGCQVPKGAWHTVEVIESSVIFESKDGKYMG